MADPLSPEELGRLHTLLRDEIVQFGYTQDVTPKNWLDLELAACLTLYDKVVAFERERRKPRALTSKEVQTLVVGEHVLIGYPDGTFEPGIVVHRRKGVDSPIVMAPSGQWAVARFEDGRFVARESG